MQIPTNSTEREIHLQIYVGCLFFTATAMPPFLSIKRQVLQNGNKEYGDSTEVSHMFLIAESYMHVVHAYAF